MTTVPDTSPPHPTKTRVRFLLHVHEGTVNYQTGNFYAGQGKVTAFSQEAIAAGWITFGPKVHAGCYRMVLLPDGSAVLRERGPDYDLITEREADTVIAPPPGDLPAGLAQLLTEVAAGQVYLEGGQFWARPQGSRRTTVGDIAWAARLIAIDDDRPAGPRCDWLRLTPAGRRELARAQTSASPDPRDADQPDSRPAEGVPGIAAGHPHPTLPQMLRRVAELVETAGLDPAVNLYITASESLNVPTIGIQVSHLTPVDLRWTAVDTLADLLGLTDASEDDRHDPSPHYRVNGRVQGVSWSVYTQVERYADDDQGGDQ